MATMGQQQSQPQTLTKKIRGLFSSKDSNNVEEQQELIRKNHQNRQMLGRLRQHLNGPQCIDGPEHNGRGPSSPGGQMVDRKPLDRQGNGGEQGKSKNEEILNELNEPLRTKIATLLESKEKWKRRCLDLEVDYEGIRREWQLVSQKLEERENDYKEVSSDAKRKNTKLRLLQLQYGEETKRWGKWTKTEKELEQKIQKLQSDLKNESDNQLQYYKQAQNEKTRVDQLTNKYQVINNRFEENRQALEARTLELSETEARYRELQKIHRAASDE